MGNTASPEGRTPGVVSAPGVTVGTGDASIICSRRQNFVGIVPCAKYPDVANEHPADARLPVFEHIVAFFTE